MALIKLVGKTFTVAKVFFRVGFVVYGSFYGQLINRVQSSIKELCLICPKMKRL